MPATKIVATLGPASWQPSTITRLAEAGVSVFRVNCSHVTTPAEVGELISAVRAHAPHCGVLVDLQGPKLRLGDGTLDLNESEAVSIGPSGTLVTNFDPHALGVQPDHRILIDDGRVELLVLAVDAGVAHTVVVTPGPVSARKGVNLPDTVVQTPALTDKDRADLAVAVAHDADWVALSFVQHPDDIAAVRALAPRQRILAKIERPQALEHLDAIVAAADGVMAARGDLGVEIPFEQVPLVQRRIVDTALRHGTVSVCATEMLESMITQSRPTRAEANDVATAIRDGFDAVMLSAETATGVDPVNAVRVMALLAATNGAARSNASFANEHPDIAAVSAAATSLAARLGCETILSLTSTGYSAALIAACRPPATIIACSPSIEVCRSLQLHHGVTPLHVARPADLQTAATLALEHARTNGLVQENQRVVLCASRLSPRSDADTIWTLTA